MKRPTPRQWLADNPGKCLQDYYQQFPPEVSPEYSAPIITATSSKGANGFTLAIWGLVLLLILIAVYPIAWSLWFVPLLFIVSVWVGSLFEEKQTAQKQPSSDKSKHTSSLQTIALILLPIFVVGVAAKYVVWNTWRQQQVILCNANLHPIEIDWKGQTRTLASKEILIEKIYDKHVDLPHPEDTTERHRFELSRGGNFFVYGPYYELLLKEVRYGKRMDGPFFIPRTKRLKSGHHQIRGDLMFHPENELPIVMRKTDAEGSIHFSVGVRQTFLHPDSHNQSEEEWQEEAIERALEEIRKIE